MKLSDAIGLVLKNKDENRVLSIAPDQSVYEAIEKMAEPGIGALLVISNHRLVCMLSERDYARKVFLMGNSSKKTLVRQNTHQSMIGNDQKGADPVLGHLLNRFIDRLIGRYR